ncbi:class Ib ribonucleoside-diphosphate reductase assembly flavoprotein NrdI [Microbacterium amylolyticum]|nr:class Ib ribonucleoside-diphosphate reductase assembly flavoprotein NrdI [Microbacterium amylolyticum]
MVSADAATGSAPRLSRRVPLIVFFSSVSGNTARFVEKLGFRAKQIPLHRHDEQLEVHEPYVLVLPTYGGGNGQGAVPKQVIRFLNDERNRAWIRGVVSTGNTNFGEAYCIAGDIISHKCQVPHLDRVELFGTPDDVARVSDGLESWWTRQ